MRVLATKPASDGKGFVKLDVNGAEVEAWTPELAKVLELGDRPVPSEWTLRDGPRGKQLLPPKQGRGGSYSQSKEAFDRSAASRREWQLLEEERKDRRTAVMTAFEWIKPEGRPLPVGEVVNAALRVSQAIYEWLRESVEGREAAPEKTELPSAVVGREGVAFGEGAHPPDPVSCDHRWESGEPAKVRFHSADYCGRCWESWVSIVEGTTADLGGAE